MRLFVLIGLITALGGSVAPATSYTVTLTSDRAVYVDRSAPDTNQQGDLLVNQGWYSSANTARTFIFFDLSSIPANALVNAVTMTVYKGVTNSGSPRMDIKAVSGNWSEDTVTFNTRPSFDSTTYASATIASEDPVGTAYEFSTPEFLGLVQSWINGTVANYGVMFEQASTSNTVAFYSDEASNAGYRPKLTVTYNVPETTVIQGDQDYRNLYQALNLLDATGKINSPREVMSIFNVKGYGAVGNGMADDTAAIQDAVNDAKAIFGVVYLPPGTYRVSSTINVTNGEFFGCRLEGANAEGTKIISCLPGTTPLFRFRGGSGRFSNVGLANMSMVAESPGNGVAVYLDGQDFGIFENLRIHDFNYGIWLHNQSAGAYTEVNQFQNVLLQFCNNGIRMEQGGGNQSFHGNGFTNCFFNVGAGQIGFNHVSGYYYNGRFRLFMWSHDTTAVYVNADGNAIRNVGDITYESFAPGNLTGSGIFWFNGYLNGGGGINDLTAHTSEPWRRTFVCNNYWKSLPYGSTDMTTGPVTTPLEAFNGAAGQIQALRKQNVHSILINTYNNNDANGLYLGRTGYRQTDDSGVLGMFLSGSGSKIKSYNSSGLALVTGDDRVALRAKDGTIAIGDGTPIARYLSVTIPWDPPSLSNGSSTTITTTVTGAAVGDLVFTSHNRITMGKVLLYGSVMAADTVIVTLVNQTGSTLNLASGTLRVSVLKHTVTDLSPRLQGKIALGGYTGDLADVAIRVDVQQNNTVVQTSRTLLDEGGNFTVNLNAAAGTYDVAIRETHSLRTVITGVPLNAGATIDLGTVALTGGDISGDNQVSFEDFSTLQNGYGRSGAAAADADAAVAATLDIMNCGPAGIVLLSCVGLSLKSLGMGTEAMTV